MKRLCSFLLMFMAFCACNIAQQRHALLVGINDYGDEEWNLRFARNDMTQLKRVLKGKGYRTTELYDQTASKQNILNKIREICSKDSIAKQLFLFYAGHGAENCIIAADKQDVTYDEIISAFSNINSREVFCFIDACHSGSAMNLGWRDSSWVRGKKINFCISCRGNEKAVEDEWISDGYFSFALRKGFRQDADTNKDKKITFNEMCKYIKKDVEERSDKKQNPQMIANKKSVHSVIVNLK